MFRIIPDGLKIKIERSVYSMSLEATKCASQKTHYYGYKIHAVCSVEGVFKSFESVHDIHYLKDIKNQFDHCVILGDKGYLSADYQFRFVRNKKSTRSKPTFLEKKESVLKLCFLNFVTNL